MRWLLLFCFTISAVCSALPPRALAGDPLLKVLPPEQRAAAPAQRYAALGHSDALRELHRRGVAFDEVPADEAPGVRTPIRLTDALNGVAIHGTQNAAVREHSAFEILDARLALSLYDFADILRRHDINEIVHLTIYRPPSRRRGAPVDIDPATTSRHPAGLAIDVALFRKRDGSELSVRKHFHGRIGAKTCRRGDAVTGPSETRDLRGLLCETADDNLFTYILSPNYNRAHYNHFHMEVKDGVRWTLVH